MTPDADREMNGMRSPGSGRTVELIVDEVLPDGEPGSSYRFGFTGNEWTTDPSVPGSPADLEHGEEVWDPSLGAVREATPEERAREPHPIGRIHHPYVERLANGKVVGSGVIELREDGDATAEHAYREALAGRLRYGSIRYRQHIDEATGRTVKKECLGVALTKRPRKPFCVVKRVHSETPGQPTGTTAEYEVSARLRVPGPGGSDTKAFSRVPKLPESAFSFRSPLPSPAMSAPAAAASTNAAPAPSQAAPQTQQQQQQKQPAAAPQMQQQQQQPESMDIDDPEVVMKLGPEQLAKELAKLPTSQLTEKALKIALMFKDAYPVAKQSQEEKHAALQKRNEERRQFLQEQASAIRDLMEVDLANEESSPFVDFLANEGSGGEQIYNMVNSAVKTAAKMRDESAQLKQENTQLQARLVELERASKRAQRVPEVPSVPRMASHIAASAKGLSEHGTQQLEQSQREAEALARARQAPANYTQGSTSLFWKNLTLPKAVQSTNAPVAALKQVEVAQSTGSGSGVETGAPTQQQHDFVYSPESAVGQRLASFHRCVREDGVFAPLLPGSGKPVDMKFIGRGFTEQTLRDLYEDLKYEGTPTDASPLPVPPMGSVNKRGRDY
jgi:hypothetical protein